MHTCSHEDSERLTLLTYIRDTPSSGPGELACSRSVLLRACTNCSAWLAVTSSLGEDTVPAQASRGKKFALQFNKTCPMVVFTLLVSSVISVFSLLVLVWSLIGFHQPWQGFRAHHMGLSVWCMKPKPSPLPSDLKRETKTGLIFSLVLLEPMIKIYYPHILLSCAHILMTVKWCFFKLAYMNQYSSTFAGDIACNTVRLNVPVFAE